MGSIAAIA